jgi:hypothetical protein
MSRLSAKNEIRWRKHNPRFTVPCYRPAENRVLRRIFGPKRDEVTGNGDNYIMKSLMICTPHPILFG